MIELRVLGSLDLNRDGREVRSVLAQPKRTALLAYLVLARPRGFRRRDELLGVFWPERPEDRARNALSQALHMLRRSLGAEAIESRGQAEVGIPTGALSCDAVRFEDALEEGDRERALELYRGELFEGFHLSDTPAFERWLQTERERLRRRAKEAAVELAERAEEEAAWVEAVRWARRALEIAPADERAARHLMRGLGRSGNRAGALKAYEALAVRLDRILGVEPSPETRTLADAIREGKDVPLPDDVEEPAKAPVAGGSRTDAGEEPTPEPPGAPSGTTPPLGEQPRTGGGRPAKSGRSWRVAVGGAAVVALGVAMAALVGGWNPTGGDGSSVPDGSIAVLPFEDLGEAEPGVFTEGLHDDLLTRLSSVSGLDVISRTAVQRYRDTRMTLDEIARELDVRWILEGGVQEMGDQIQVNAQLVDPRTEAHAWAESYRRALTADSLFDLQTEIATEIVGALETRLGPAERARVERAPTGDLAAFRLYVRGRSQMDTRTREGMRRAVDYFERAVRLDSTYALAWSGLADTRALMVVYGYASRDTLLQRAATAAERALSLDPDLAEAHTSMGLIHDVRSESPAAIREYRRALELKPSYARASYWLGLELQDLGRLAEARAPLLRAVELDPMSPVYHNGLLSWYLWMDSLEKALEEARKHDEFGDQPAAPSRGGEVLALMGRLPEARAHLLRAVERTETGTMAHVWARLRLAETLARMGEDSEARELLEGIGEDERTYPDVAELTGRAHAALGDRDSALAYLAEALPPPGRLRHDPHYAPLRQDPRWEELVRRSRRAWGLEAEASDSSERN